ncbi:unnamed protein product, partial [Symbiodinium sp. KB8]
MEAGEAARGPEVPVRPGVDLLPPGSDLPLPQVVGARPNLPAPVAPASPPAAVVEEVDRAQTEEADRRAQTEEEVRAVDEEVRAAERAQTEEEVRAVERAQTEEEVRAVDLERAQAEEEVRRRTVERARQVPSETSGPAESHAVPVAGAVPVDAADAGAAPVSDSMILGQVPLVMEDGIFIMNDWYQGILQERLDPFTEVGESVMAE